ncbi:uncharacterized protein [Malus domestica]|uniref:uncharacterized protein isoform X4 n=1 Tax=Malus domestica TaxID=3750 RepID=UPI003976470A
MGWLISLTDFILLHFQEASVFIEVSYSQIGINLKELRLFAVFKFDPNTSRNYLCMDHYCNPFSTDELQMMDFRLPLEQNRTKWTNFGVSLVGGRS